MNTCEDPKIRDLKENIAALAKENEALKKENAMLKDAALGTPCEQIRHAEEIEALKKENEGMTNHAGRLAEMVERRDAEIEALKAQIDDMSSTFTSKESVVQDAKRWKYACDNWTFLIKKYMRSGFEGPRLEELVEFWSVHDNAAMDGEK